MHAQSHWIHSGREYHLIVRSPWLERAPALIVSDRSTELLVAIYPPLLSAVSETERAALPARPGRWAPIEAAREFAFEARVALEKDQKAVKELLKSHFPRRISSIFANERVWSSS